MLRLEGRGYPVIYSKCGGCGEADLAYRCAQQTCYRPGLFCRRCIVVRHTVLPTHWIQEWNGSFFRRCSLKDLGLVIQLGHPAGFSCPNPLSAHTNFVVIDITGIHHIRVNFCQCDGRIEHRQQLMRVNWWPATVRDSRTCATFGVVRLFQIMNCLGKISAHDFLRSLELLTNNDGLSPVLDCRRAFRHIVRQYRTTLMLKRAGRGHEMSGVRGTAQGELALPCRACPHAGRNLPDGWNNINWDAMPEDLRYKYFLFLAQDCNFRLINRNVSSATKDPILGDGFAYFVNQEKYVDFLRNHVSETEISSCSGFQAMFLANRKRVKGLRTTGVGGVTCARHNMWRPNGIGDLQLGERYCNMDFIFASAVLNAIIFYLILSYDIAYQYGKNFWSRMEDMPTTIQFILDHATHGETAEQNWEFTNGAAPSTKTMGIGTRHATLEDLFGFHNWRRQVAWRGIFTKQMAENVKEGQIHRDAFDVFDAALHETAPEMVEGWKKWVHEWESRQHKDGTESPFELKEKGESFYTFILMGLEIEESQQHLAIDVKAVANPTDAQSVEFLKRRTNLLKRIRAFRKLQRTYMPRLRVYLTASQRALFDSETDRNAEVVRLFMPSDILDAKKRVLACAMGLPDTEADLRMGEAREALGALLKIHKAKIRYRYARNAIKRLKGDGPWEVELKILEDEDVQALNERALTAEEKAQKKTIHDYGDVEEDGGEAVRPDRGGAGGRYASCQMSIWLENSDFELAALRVEWCKAYARMRRWHEDVVLVEEEMHPAGAWARREGGRAGQVESELQEGLVAYAREQQWRERETCGMLGWKWTAVRAKGRAYLARETAPGVEVVVVDEEEYGLGGADDDEGSPDYEDKGDDEVVE
ncbi:hypothetical protein C8R45DRAFT_1053137 [Mycena sanguinolenta]|nr:hypothetical protein C8R45DRAFT_1053137 [Mycena sanguinolenta]